jgi:uncharacterized protein (TIGR02145 family)
MKKVKTLEYLFALVLILSIVTYGCNNEDPAMIPVAGACEIVSVSQTTARISVTIESDGGAPIIERGVCWSSNPDPSISDGKTSDGSGTGSYTSSVSGLSANTLYYLRSFASNSAGTAYGEVIFVKTRTGEVSDVDGNTYTTVTIGNQVWMAENLKTTKYNDGNPIPNVTDGIAWGTLKTPGYCWYENNISNKEPYGALYNWYTIQNGNLCPTGWHVPTDTEWLALANYLGGLPVAGGKLKEIGVSHWITPNTTATNETGFTAVAGGGRVGELFSSIKWYANYWTATEYDSETAYSTCAESTSALLWYHEKNWTKRIGFSIRCIKE